MKAQHSILRRGGSTSPVVIMLLAGILLALVGLIIVLVMQGGGKAPSETPPPVSDAEKPAVADGQEVSRSEISNPPPASAPIDDPERIMAGLPVGRNLASALKVGIQARAEDKQWWRREVIDLVYLAELQIDRTVEENDGKRLVELRHFEVARNAKLLCDVKDAQIDLGLPGVMVLGALARIKPGVASALTAAKPIADAILRQQTQSHVDEQSAKAVAHVDSLQGKRVRIVYVDGIGVTSIEPIGCSLSAEERNFLFATASFSDFHLLRDVLSKPGDEWSVNATEIAGLIDPSLRGRPSGEIRVRRMDDANRNGKRYASLRIRSGSVELDSSDASTRRIGSFAPEGDMEYDLDEGFVSTANLKGRFRIEQVSKDHLFFETSFRVEPDLTVQYDCRIR